MEKYFFKVSNSSSIAQNQPNGEENANNLEVPSHSSQEFDLSSLKADPGERTQILEFHPNHRDVIRRAYLQKKPCQPLLREFPQTNIFGDVRRFNHKWFDEFPDWLEYNISKDTAFCLYCYLFKQNNNLQGGGETFSSVGFRSWHKKASLQTHIGGHTASVERAFLGMKFIKNELRSRMNDDFLSGCMVPFMEKDVFKDVSTDDIILSFQAMKPRRIVL
ncbi:uncharacterized protein LOC125853760 [Solanum stenotomum]|uniref:uncharacterized protein LOC125853760 n=1 Tax=Solanum stenotomum TaxID=172797 RepID=UPI0020D1270E|nr:uncharacterized protein LOC125853760 [Solanum stenotomum]